ncbi:hypothetical protein [Pedobacter antarcticus]|uniref:hypothetical protein n=1 Tax=Pedobacter antarcticus TaxID=34086 RepID=UPI00292EEFB4|nr:hypothetical protein [Pedobacter antarcticus]
MKPKFFATPLKNPVSGHLLYLRPGVVILLFLTCICCYAQETQEALSFYTWLDEGEQSEEQLALLTQKLEQLRKKPVALNQAGETGLTQIFFFTPLQIYDLLQHIHKNGPLKEISELQVVRGFSPEFIRQISPYITCDQAEGKLPQFKDLFSKSEHDLILRHTRIYQRKKGYTKKGKSYYSGSPDHLLLKYRLTLEPGIKVMLLMEKDPGEQFLKGSNPYGFDFISANITYTGKGRISKLIIGDYSLQFGQGLSLWSGTSFGRGADVAGAAKKDMGLQSYFSAGEQNYFRGFSLEYKIFKSMLLTNFISIKNSDASISYLTDKTAVISNISSSGLHRTESEIRNKGAVKEIVTGTAIQYNGQFFRTGITAYKSTYSLPFITGDALYRSNYFSGTSRENYAFHYNYTFLNTYTFGEFAGSRPGGHTWIQGLISAITPATSTVVVFRNYGKDHISFYSMPFGKNSSAMNEKGFYTGINHRINKKWNLAGYIDFFSFPFAKYRVDLPSQGNEYAIKLFYSPARDTEYSFQYRSSSKEENVKSGLKTPVMDDIQIHLIRLDATYPAGDKIRLRHLADFTRYSKGQQPAGYGILLGQDLHYKATASPFSGNIRVSWFNIPSYNNRIYRYENNVLFAGSSVPYQGQGFRAYLNTSFSFNKQFRMWFRYAITWQPGKVKTGTGMEEIQGSQKRETRLQVRYNF